MKTLLILILFFFLSAHSGEAEIYRWKDEHGTIHVTDNFQSIPLKYRSKLKVTKAPRKIKKQKTSVKRTVVKFWREGNSILLNVALNYSQPRVFILDTGASYTMILESDAEALGINYKQAPTIKSTVADGRVLEFPMVRLNSIRVGDAEVRDASVIVGVGNVRLLGLNFIKEFKMVIDSKGGNLILDAPESINVQESKAAKADKKKAQNELKGEVKKAKLTIKQVKKNIKLLDIQINQHKNKKLSLKKKLRKGLKNNVPQSEISDLESYIKQYDLAIESREIAKDTQTENIKILKNNIRFYRQRIQELR